MKEYEDKINKLITELEETLTTLYNCRNEQWYLDALDRINKLSVIW